MFCKKNTSLETISSERPMVSFAVMLHLFLVFLFTPFPSFLPCARNLIGADEELIKQECHNAESPEVCLRCVKSDPGSPGADEAGIAAIVANCTSNKTTTLQSNMADLLLRATDQDLKNAFQDCLQGYSQANKDLSQVIFYLNKGDYDNADSFVRKALQFEVICRGFIMGRDWQIPAIIVHYMDVYEELAEVEMRIIDRLP